MSEVPTLYKEWLKPTAYVLAENVKKISHLNEMDHSK